MRTLRKVFCVLALAALITSGAAFAAPEPRPDASPPSLGSWVVSMLDSIVAYILPDEADSSLGDDGLLSKPGQGEAERPQEKNGGEDPPDDEFGGGVDPNG